MRLSTLNPPELVFSDEFHWVSCAAFAKARPLPPIQNTTRVLDVADSLELTARISVRCERELTEVLGPALAREFALRRLRVVAAHDILRDTATRVTHAAERANARVALLKSAALAALGVCAPGTRAARDVDVLTSQADASRLFDALVNSGYRARVESSTRFHLAPLWGPRGDIIELHVCVPGLELEPGVEVTLSALERAGLLETWNEHPNVTLPTRSVLVAHALVHALVQHANVPKSYPMMRLLCDIVDLSNDFSARELERVEHMLTAGIAPELVRASIALANELRLGSRARDLSPRSLEARLLRHAVLASCDIDYQALLGLGRFQQLRSADDLWRVLRGLVFPSEEELRVRLNRAAAAPVVWRDRLDVPLAIARETARGIAARMRRRSEPLRV